MKLPEKDAVAYFCAEFGIEKGMPTYAGGLGILAADLLKAAADENFPMIGVGLMYKGRFSIQKVLPDGWQEELDNNFSPEDFAFSQVLINGNPLYVVANLAGEDVWISAYHKAFSDNTHLLMLTTDNDYNTQIWKEAMVAEYCCDDENQLRQQMILGIGGVKILNALGIKPKLYHLNEGRPIFLNWQLIHQIICTERVGFEKAFEKAKQRTIYSNHTLLRAGNLVFPKQAIQKYATGYVNALGEDSQKLIDPGLEEEGNKFSITKFALNISSYATAVSKLHGKLSKKQWPGYNWEAITNGVHLPTWQKKEYSKTNLSNDKIWKIHNDKKAELAQFVQEKTGFGYDTNRLVISWARRIADYKQLSALFSDLKRLRNILSNPQREIQLLISGKGHYGDEWAKKTIQEVIGYMQNELTGYALYIPNYNIEVAQKLVSGSDVWLNTPKYGLEASGTSGMKACANGVLNATVADGWAHEVDWEGKGWVLDHKNIESSIYKTIDDKIAPLFYKRDSQNTPVEWVDMMKNSIKEAEKFSAKRMLKEYIQKVYS